MSVMVYRTFRNRLHSFPFLCIGRSFSLKARRYYVAGTGLSIISVNSHRKPRK